MNIQKTQYVSPRGLTAGSLINIESETGVLKKVLIHTPGPEVECISPEEIEKYLFHGLVFLKDLLKGYSVFKNVLSKVSKVYEIKECLADVFENIQTKEICLDKVLHYYGKPEFKNKLLSFDAHTLARVLIEGLDQYGLQPLPNLYFARDTNIVVGKKLITAHMASPVRFVETILTRTIFEHHPDFKIEGFLLDNHFKNVKSLTIEGGDVHIWNKDLYLIGFSSRTNANAIDAFVDALIQERKYKKDDTPFHVLSVCLPPKHSMIHLDMIFTRLNEFQALGYAPAFLGPNPFNTIKISVNHYEKHSEQMDNLLIALKSLGYPMELIFCGGNESLLIQQREQWTSGANSVAFGPGKIISYENEHTLRALEKGGFKIVNGVDFIKNFETHQYIENIVVSIDGSQLSQGGGGPRCMTCPLLRE